MNLVIIWIFTSLSHPEIPERIYAFNSLTACEEARTSSTYPYPSDRCVAFESVIVEFDPTILGE